MSNVKSGVNRFSENDLYVGDGTSVSKKILIDDGYADGYKAYIEYDSATREWRYSNNGETDVNLLHTEYTAGDIIYADAENSLDKLPIGTEGYVLKVNSGVPSWQEDSNTTVHNDLTGKDGGGVDGYFHFDQPEYNWLKDGYDQQKWIETKGGTNQDTYAAGDILYASAIDTLSKLTASDDGYVLTLSSGVPTWDRNNKQITQVMVGKINVLSADTDGYLLGSFVESSDEKFPAYVANTSCIVKNLTATMSGALSAGETVQVTVRLNGSDTAITVTLDDATPQNTAGTLRIEQDTSNEISLVNGDRVNVRFTSSSSSDAEDVMVSFDVF